MITGKTMIIAHLGYPTEGFVARCNATPLGMKPGDALPLDVTALSSQTFVGDVVLSDADRPLIRAARAAGYRVQPGIDMLYEQIPAYLEFFGFGTATVEELRAVAR